MSLSRRLACAGLAGLLTLAGCGGASSSSGGPGATVTATRTVTRSASPSQSPSQSPSRTPTAGPSTSSSAPPTRAPGLRGRLLVPSEVPVLRAGHRWTTGSTTSGEGQAPFATCQRTSLAAIGASRVVVRAFAPHPSAGADESGSLVAVFPDAMTARRAYGVLDAWRQRCRETFPAGDDVTIGAPTDVAVAAGSALFYTIDLGPVGGAAHRRGFDVSGVALLGKRIAVLQAHTAARSADPAWDAAVTAGVQAAAARLA